MSLLKTTCDAGRVEIDFIDYIEKIPIKGTNSESHSRVKYSQVESSRAIVE